MNLHSLFFCFNRSRKKKFQKKKISYYGNSNMIPLNTEYYKNIFDQRKSKHILSLFMRTYHNTFSFIKNTNQNKVHRIKQNIPILFFIFLYANPQVLKVNSANVDRSLKIKNPHQEIQVTRFHHKIYLINSPTHYKFFPT